MPKAYSYDLRKKVMESIDKGESRASLLREGLKLDEQHYMNGEKEKKKQETSDQKNQEV